MSCSSCGGSADKVYKFLSDGMVKEVSYCSKCLKKVLVGSEEFSKSGLRYLASHSEIVQDSDLGEISVDLVPTDIIFSIAPVAVLRILFDKGQNFNDLEEKEVFRRRIFLLRYKLNKALENEDYKTANKLKNQIAAIEKRIAEK
ncbi:UvrB/UvrC motif-containing protein [Pseudothermotoga thermarum]|uniref:UVR domain-containing protein n=1 Tax=Pseudothermotoga thermarum DSM 5069 TaxID=688269 RepID=F7YYA3_9THEM|nr:UvrB/UvrC motif-containing protein [Pseudothermotoga thermarum]AEH50924.1 hypothetical protein Theth_0840 [Pseudothermotoga thermarum DSM 5069]